MKISDLKPGMRVMREGTVTGIVKDYVMITWDGSEYGMDYDKNSLDNLSICDEESTDSLDEMVRDFTAIGSRPKSEVRRRIEEHTRTFKREILLEIAEAIEDSYKKYGSAYQFFIIENLRKRSEKL